MGLVSAKQLPAMILSDDDKIFPFLLHHAKEKPPHMNRKAFH
jgi:hypothetical protein